ncbi:MAG: pitrilysin family protein [Candidatus Nanopusillus sp.]|nr:pitrilysin family protein [Candidatus Nanopusillus sp.]
MVDYEILDNGIKLYKIPFRNENIAIGILVNIGSIFEDKEFRGISHLLEHMMFQSNKKYNKNLIHLLFEESGSIHNAITYYNYTLYFAAVTKEGFENIVDLFYWMFENDKYDNNEFENEKNVVKTEIMMREDDPIVNLNDNLSKSVYGDSDYGDPIGGYIETINNITKDKLEEFKYKYYSPKNISIFLEGNISDKDVEIVKKYFSRLEGDNVKLKNPSKGKGEDIIIKMKNIQQIYYSINMNSDIKNIILIDALTKFYNLGASSKIFEIFRNKHGIGYSPSLSLSNFYDDEIVYSLIIPGFQIDKEKIIDNAIREFLDNLKNIDDKYKKARSNIYKFNYNLRKENILKRIETDPYLIKILNMDYDQYFNKVYSLLSNIDRDFIEENEKYIYDLFEKGKKVIIYPEDYDKRNN